MKNIIIIFLLLPLLLHQTFAFNILFFHSVCTFSHRSAIWPLAVRLADLGHNVTYIFPMENGKRLETHPNIEEIVPSKMVELNRNFVGDFDINIRLQNRVVEWQFSVFKTAVQMCESIYDSPEVQRWLSRPNLHYDLVLFDGSLGECAYGLVHKFKAKHIMFAPVLAGLWYDAFGIVPESSSIPDVMVPYKPNQMTLLNRAWNTILPLLFRYFIHDYFNGIGRMIREKMNASDMPSISDIQRNTSMVFYNSYFVENYGAALPPMFISYSGITCPSNKQVKTLPKDLTEFLKDDDFVYVSFGSAVDVGNMPVELRNKFFHAFRSFPKLKFLWRWNGPIPEDKPENVFLAPWFPQQDVLAHHKVKAFIMQAGIPSTQEALCFNVPLITIPIFGDQDFNANRMEMLGAGIVLHIDTLTASDIANAIKEVVYKPKYKENMRKLSEMFKDRPVDPLDNLVYWTEYAIRYDTSIMKSLGMEQTWYQRRLLDVYGFIALVMLVAVAVVVIFARVLFRKFYNLCFIRNLKDKKTN